MGTIDCTPGDGLMAMTHIRARIPYVGVTLTAAHKQEVYDRLLDMTFCAMANTDDALAEPGLVALLSSGTAEASASGGRRGPNPGPKKKPRTQPEPAAGGEDYMTKIEAALAARGGAPAPAPAPKAKGKAKAQPKGKAALTPPPAAPEEELEEEDADISPSAGE